MAHQRSQSPNALRWRRFRRIKRGYYSFAVLLVAYVLSFFLPFLMGNRPIAVSYQGKMYFPAFSSYWFETFGLGKNKVYLGEEFQQQREDGSPVYGEADYRLLQRQFAESASGDWVWMPLVPYSPTEQFLDLAGNPPHPPSTRHWLGTDTAARDVLVRLAYGFRVSVSFAVVVTVASFLVGTLAGGLLGYYGRWLDIIGFRLVEIWNSIPLLYTVIILASIFRPNFLMLAMILTVFGWMGIAFYVRGEFYREKAKDYTAAAIVVGERDWAVILRHILPNSLTPIIAFAPFAMVGNIVAVVSLDFLGFGLPAPTASWGELLRQAKDGGTSDWHIVLFPLAAMFITLQLIVFIGEAVREAFDPKVYSRIR